MEESIIFAKKYLEDILSFFGLNIDVHASRDEEVIELSVPSTHMNGFLIGQHGETMHALQYLVSTALANGGYEYSRVNVDVADYKKGRQDRLAKQTLVWVDKVKTTGKAYELAPMNAADRRIIHKVAEEHGLTTESQGFGRDRHVVMSPPTASKDDEYEEDVAEEPTKEDAIEGTSEIIKDEPDAEKPVRIRKKPSDKAQSVDEYLEKEAAKAEAADTSTESAEDKKPSEPEPKKTTRKEKD
jgi:spoIIIJ-associated protein